MASREPAQEPKPLLVSFELCPFVQRAVITLHEKGVDHELRYIDLAHPPEWFLRLSPLGKVPVLRVGDAVLFESAVINEYLDETHPPSLHPHDPLQRARNRAWIEFGSSLLMAGHGLMVAPDREAFEAKEAELTALLARLEPEVVLPWFNGPAFSLVDAAIAPFFQRLAVIETLRPGQRLESWPRLRRWGDELLRRPSVAASVPPEFDAKLAAYLRAKGAYVTNGG